MHIGIENHVIGCGGGGSTFIGDRNANKTHKDMINLIEHTVTDPEVLRGELEKIRKAGFAVVREELEKDFVAIGAEFRGPLGEVQGTISIGGPSSRFPRRRTRSLGLQLRREADELSQRRVLD